jgi:integrase/recombinase XerD
MPDNNLLGTWIRRFLLEHLVGERNLARNTQISYRDTLALLISFVAKKCEKQVDRLTIEDITPEIVRSFLDHIEKDRGCGVTTRNQRLAAAHALSRFVAIHSPEHISWCSSIQTVPLKRGFKPSISYLEKAEINALLDAPDRKSAQGFRDYALLLFLYNAGARADEAARIKVCDLDMGDPPAINILRKGKKTRLCPLWSLTVNTLTHLISGRMPNDRVFLNRRKEPIARFGIHAAVRRHVLEAGERIPSLLAKRVSPHTGTQLRFIFFALAWTLTRFAPGWDVSQWIQRMSMQRSTWK